MCRSLLLKFYRKRSPSNAVAALRQFHFNYQVCWGLFLAPPLCSRNRWTGRSLAIITWKACIGNKEGRSCRLCAFCRLFLFLLVTTVRGRANAAPNLQMKTRIKCLSEAAHTDPQCPHKPDSRDCLDASIQQRGEEWHVCGRFKRSCQGGS